MIAALICVMSLAALLQFGIAQWRSIWIAIAAQPLSSTLPATTGIENNAICADHFEMLVHASSQMCPSPLEKNLWMKEVTLYYWALHTLLKLPGRAAFPSVSNWATRELTECARFAAAILDRRLIASFAYDSAGQQA